VYNVYYICTLGKYTVYVVTPRQSRSPGTADERTVCIPVLVKNVDIIMNKVLYSTHDVLRYAGNTRGVEY